MLGALVGSGVNLLLFSLHYAYYLNSTGLATGKKELQDCKKYCRIELKANLRQYRVTLASPADNYSIGRVSEVDDAEIAWKHYEARVSLRYKVSLEGFPRDKICDPSNLSASELTTLRESLVNGTCGFQKMLPADVASLRAKVEEQVKRGENPWGKRKRRNDADKSRKKQKIPESTESAIHHSSPSRSCSPSDYQVHEPSSTVESDSDAEDTSPDNGAGGLRKFIGKRALNAANPAHCSSSVSATATAVSATATASSSAACPAPTPSTGTNATLGRTQRYYGGVLPTT